jgi:hypothetical protein
MPQCTFGANRDPAAGGGEICRGHSKTGRKFSGSACIGRGCLLVSAFWHLGRQYYASKTMRCEPQKSGRGESPPMPRSRHQETVSRGSLSATVYAWIATIRRPGPMDVNDAYPIVGAHVQYHLGGHTWHRKSPYIASHGCSGIHPGNLSTALGLPPPNTKARWWP